MAGNGGKVLRRRVEEKEKRQRMEKEEEDVKLCDFFTDRVDLSLFERYSVENQLFFFQPLFQKQSVGWCFCDLVKWVGLFRHHD